MALHDLTLPGMEFYGGIELKRNYRKYLTSALGISVGIHLLIILLYIGWSFFTEEDVKKVPHIRIKALTDLAPPPSTSEQVQETIPIDAAPPAADVAKPNFGIPVPVPDAVAPDIVMQDLNKIPDAGIPSGTGTVSGIVGGTGNQPVHVEVKQPVEEAAPSKDEFIATDEDPAPITNIQSLVVYPEIAKRANLEGKVTASVLIGKDGRVEKVEIEKADFDVFKQAAIDALMKARYTPAKQNGNPVRVWMTVPLTFKLNQH